MSKTRIHWTNKELISMSQKEFETLQRTSYALLSHSGFHVTIDDTQGTLTIEVEDPT